MKSKSYTSSKLFVWLGNILKVTNPPSQVALGKEKMIKLKKSLFKLFYCMTFI